MEPIRRPDNVSVPRNISRRIEARRALQGTVEDMRAALKSFGHKVPSSAKKEDLEKSLYEVMRDGNALTVDDTSATAGAAAAKGVNNAV